MHSFIEITLKNLKTIPTVNNVERVNQLCSFNSMGIIEFNDPGNRVGEE